MFSSELTAPNSKGKDLGNAAVGIVLVNWNGPADCIDCLDSLVGILRPDDHVYLVDKLQTVLRNHSH